MPDAMNRLKLSDARLRLFKKLGIGTITELLRFFPFDYEDRTVIKRVAELADGETVCVRATVSAEPRVTRTAHGREVLRLGACDGTGSLDLVYSNQKYLQNVLTLGKEFTFYGKVSRFGSALTMTNPDYERGGVITPRYHLTAGLTQKAVSAAVRKALSLSANDLPNALPRSVEERYELCGAGFAYENIHFPQSFAALAAARRRFLFEELFVIAALSGFRRRLRGDAAGTRFEPCDLTEFYASLPFSPTDAQKRAIIDAERDLFSGSVMNRLVQGDVGSGKTLVAMALCYLAAKNGAQTAFMAPTELLAEQHYRSFIAALEPLGLRVGLLTGSLGAKTKREAREGLAYGQLDVVVGTHALISDGVEYNNLGLVITDEQHRFGVNQRAKLGQKGAADGVSPHVLVMSATPIPRTLALILYGDLDVSTIDELPPGRQKIETYTVGEDKRERTYSFARKLVAEGRQVYIVCPSIEDNEEMPNDLKHAREYAENLQSKVFPDLRVGLVHGAMKPAEKDEAMSAFVAGETQILVATTVIEVGVDVPNAALMLVENAERFGLSQLHQLRGRVGRGEHESFCVLFEGAGGDAARVRLDALTETTDGFEIAERDLAQRGPGDFFGSRQSGIPASRFAELAADGDTIIKAREAADAVLGEDPELDLPENAPLRRRVDAILAQAEGTIN